MAEVFGVLPGDHVAAAAAAHRGHEVVRRRSGRVIPIDLAQSAGRGQPDRLVHVAGILGPERGKHLGDRRIPAARRRGTLASGANRSTVPKFVFVATARRVAAIAARIVAPTRPSTAASMAGPMATALATKISNVRSSKSAPRCTFPGFGAETSKRHANVAHWPIERRCRHSGHL